ncbi:MAG: hypothetical protein II698_07895 [Ruminococcus sp.]|nr:hypothetical protein [Ruminococcus sp.]
MKDKLQHAMKPTPERFRYAVQMAVDEAVTQPSPKKRLSKGWRVAIAIIILAALIPSAVFGASKLYELIAKPVDNYGLAVGVDETQISDYPLYVKIHVDIPEGFAVVPDTEDLKYCKADSEEAFDSGFSLLPMRYADSDQQAYIANVDSYEECVVSGHQAYNVTVKNVKGTWEQLYVYFEDVNVMLLIYHKDVTAEQIEDFVSGISFTEGTAADHTYLSEPYDERQDSAVTYKYEESFVEMPLDTKLTFKHYSPVTEDESQRYTAQITNIRITDEIIGLDESCFNHFPDTIAQENGRLIPKESTTFKEGDGFSSTYEELSVEQKEQKLILAEITYENLTDEDVELYIPYRANVLNKDGNEFRHAESIDPKEGIYSTACCDTEIVYLSPHGEGKSFYIPTLPANETMNVTVGIRCNADMLDKAYLTIDGINDIIDPLHDGDGNYTTYLFKVLDDDR